MVLKYVLAGIAIVTFVGIGGYDKLKELFKSSGVSDQVQRIIIPASAETMPTSEKEIITKERIQVISDNTPELNTTTTSKGIDEKTGLQIPFSEAAEQFKAQRREVQALIDSGKLPFALTERDFEDIKALDARATGQKGKFTGLETVVAKQIEELKAFATLKGSGATFSSETGKFGRPKLFGKEGFASGGLTAEEAARRAQVEAERATVRSEVTGLTHAESNILGELNRAERDAIEQSISGFDPEEAKRRLAAKGIVVSGDLTQKQLATILQSTGVTI